MSSMKIKMIFGGLGEAFAMKAPMMRSRNGRMRIDEKAYMGSPYPASSSECRQVRGKSEII